MLHAATIQAPFTAPATLGDKAERARAEFISSTEPECAAHYAYAAEDAGDIEYLARELVSFARRARARLQALTYGAREADAEDLIDCLTDQIADRLTHYGARYLAALVEADKAA